MKGRTLSLLSVALLLAPLVLPQLLGLSGVSQGPAAEEKRAKAEVPTLAMAAQDLPVFAKKLSSYYADNFPFRDFCIRAGNSLSMALFRESPSKSVVLGRQGWLFNSSESELADWLNLWQFSAEELDHAVSVLSERRDWLARQGIAFLVVIAPNKTTVYGEYLPQGFRKLGDHPRLDDLAKRLTGAGIDFLDLRPTLFAAKAKAQAYWKTDTHWDDWGALLGSARIVQALGQRLKNITPIRPEDYQAVEADVPGGDLAAMLLMEGSLGERLTRMKPKFTPRAFPAQALGYKNPTTLSGRDMVIRETGDLSLPRAVFFRDSFSSAAIPFLAEHFSRSVFIWDHHFSPEIVLAEKPDVVVLEAVERYQHAVLLDNPPLP